MSVLSSANRRAAPLGTGLCLVAACGGADRDAAPGQALFEAHCVSCHGEGARGDGPLASALPVPPPSILEHLGHHTQAQLVQLIRTGIPPAMPPAPLGEEEVRQIIDHAWTLVPPSEVAALRAMQEQAEATGGSATPGGQGAGTVAVPPAGAQEFAFAGTVQSVDPQARTVAVLNDDVPGWMGSMTMTYSVDRPTVLDSLEAGDRITAKVYAGDFRILYEVEAAPR